LKKQPKLSEKERHNPKMKKSLEKSIDERGKDETGDEHLCLDNIFSIFKMPDEIEYEYVAVETDNSGF